MRRLRELKDRIEETRGKKEYDGMRRLREGNCKKKLEKRRKGWPYGKESTPPKKCGRQNTNW